jgi:hypothetical protein
MLPPPWALPRHRACARIGFPIALGATARTSGELRTHYGVQARPCGLSQIDADVDEIDTRADEADSRVHKALQNAFGA